ncbi:MAG: calcium/sodium antiporter [Pseudomonadales bacterium]
MYLMPLLAILVGFIILVWSADRFVIGASATAFHLGVSPLVVGIVIVGFGTSAPEMLVSAMAALDGNGNLSIGNALGSNITNVGLILGITALFYPLVVRSRIIRREIPLLFFVMLVALFLMSDGKLSLLDGIILASGFVAVLLLALHEAATSKDDTLAQEFQAEIPPAVSNKAALMWLIVGIVLLVASSRLLVWGAVEIAELLGITDLIIGLTIVAIGTSLPELAATVVAARKQEYDIAVGNVVGSNLFNLLGVLAFPGLLSPGSFDPAVLVRDYPVMIALTFLLLIFASNYSMRKEGEINRVEGAILLSIYIGYMIYLAATA